MIDTNKRYRSGAVEYSGEDALPDIKLSDVITFEILCQNKTLRKAAKSMFISPQGLSKQLQLLEQKLDARLFRRTNRGISLTPSGERFRRFTRLILQEAASLRADLAELRTPKAVRIDLVCSGVLAGTAPQTYANGFLQQYAGGELDIVRASDAHVIELASASLPLIALTTMPVDPAPFHVTRLETTRYLLLVHASHPLAARSSLSFQDLHNLPLILCDELDLANQHLVARCRKRDIACQVKYRTSSFIGANKLCKQNLGAAVILDFVAPELDTSELVSVPFRDRDARVDTVLLRKKDFVFSDIEKAFIEYMERYADTAGAPEEA